ncbi:MAG: hypothetical protein R2854_03595 [Caldilineaceae bacterium]
MSAVKFVPVRISVWAGAPTVAVNGSTEVSVGENAQRRQRPRGRRVPAC